MRPESPDTTTRIQAEPFPGPPSPNGRNGRDLADTRDARGRFAPGNPGGPGNPHARAVHQHRSALLAAVTEADIVDIARMLVRRAKAGDVHAVRELFRYCIGNVAEAVSVDTTTDRVMDRLSGASPQAAALMAGCRVAAGDGPVTRKIFLRVLRESNTCPDASMIDAFDRL